ncbi:hypothetical protein CTAYLR_003071 [Chrysophaeum taylorii]|uniref:FAD-binding PCMH-type domain-containing protein n=1 Tax=Chrysophaeum taylorii TaxID=2483200 RepID=A0AAD7XGQ3_9STRA|nr:hypothetical protein CTAYLR_003071 [Chrysophaeum taylorii]
MTVAFSSSINIVLTLAVGERLEVRRTQRLVFRGPCNWTGLEFNGLVVGGDLELWNRHSDRYLGPPCAVLEPFDASAVQAAIRYARDHGLPLRVNGGGHDYLTYSSWNGPVLSTKRLERIEVGHDTLVLGAGVRWGEAYAQLDRYVAGGLSPNVGVIGFLLGGGINHNYCRSYGLGVDNMLSATLVTAAGDLVRASRDENPDLFWALRGGGGSNFGVVTDVELRLGDAYESSGAIQYFFRFLRDTAAVLRRLQHFALEFALEDTRLGVEAHASAADDVQVLIQWNARKDADTFSRYLSAFASTNQIHHTNWHLDRACDGLDFEIRSGAAVVVRTACFAQTAGVDHIETHSKPLNDLAQTGDNWFVDRVGDDLIHHALEIQRVAKQELDAHFVICLEFFYNCSKDDTAFPHADSWLWYWECFTAPGEPQAACDALGTNLSLATDRTAAILGSYTNYNTDKYADTLDLVYGPSLSRLSQVKRDWDPTDFFRHEKSIPLPDPPMQLVMDGTTPTSCSSDNVSSAASRKKKEEEDVTASSPLAALPEEPAAAAAWKL